MRFRVVHRTEYGYDEVVNQSHGRAHLLPREEPGQTVLSKKVVIDPTPDEQHDHVDYFGNASSYFRLVSPHDSLTVTSTSTVDVDRTVVPWEQLDESVVPHRRPWTLEPLQRELVLPSPLVPRIEEIERYAGKVLVSGAPLGAALFGLLDRIHTDYTYESGATTVTTPLETLLRLRKGVCQDFAHLMIGCLRSVGLPARYVSGYLQTLPPPGRPRLVGADASHAWVSVLVPGHGWVDLDPTNDQQADQRYVVVARGRDYSDVPPLKGVIFTRSTKSTLKVSVDVEPLV